MSYANSSEDRPVSVLLRSLDYDEPPHVHVKRENMVAKFWLEPVALQKSGGFSRSELNKIARLVNDNSQVFLEGWYEFFGS